MQPVTDKILNDARKEAEAIGGRFEAEAEAIRRQYAERVAALQQAQARDLERMRRARVTRAVAHAQLEARKRTTQEKQRVLDEVINEAFQKFMAGKEYRRFIEQVIERSGETEGEVILAQRDIAKYGAALEKSLKAQKKKINVHAGEIEGGVMVRNGSRMFIGSLDLLRELLRDEIVVAVSKVLF